MTCRERTVAELTEVELNVLIVDGVEDDSAAASCGAEAMDWPLRAAPRRWIGVPAAAAC